MGSKSGATSSSGVGIIHMDRLYIQIPFFTLHGYLTKCAKWSLPTFLTPLPNIDLKILKVKLKDLNIP